MLEIHNTNILGRGKQAFITRQEPALSDICRAYGRDPVTTCLKVFHGNPLSDGQTIKDALWGDNHDPNDSNQVRRNTNLLEGSKIQNLCWLHGLAPRVYAVFLATWEGKRVAVQLTDYIQGKHPRNQSETDYVHNELVALGKLYGFSEVKNILSNDDIIDNKCIDLQQFAFDRDAKEKITAIYVEKAKYGKVYYQNVPELGLCGGPRQSISRIDSLKLNRVDFRDKVVWDIGCAGGFFCRYAIDSGAKRVIGFDEKSMCIAATVLSQYLGYFNIDYEAVDLNNGLTLDYKKPDVVLFLSMNYHLKVPEIYEKLRIFEAEYVVFEDNGKETRGLDVLGAPWIDHFRSIRFIGRATDHGDKAIYHLSKEVPSD